MKKTVIYIFIVFVLAFSSCMRLDSNLYNNDNTITSYQLDNYSGEQDFILDATYKIPDSLIHHFTLSSLIPGESSAKKIHAIYLGSISKIATDTVIMYCHGNKWHMDFYWQRAKLMAHIGGKNHYGVMMIDYRGFGMSEGEPTEDGMYADVDAAFQWLKLNGLTSQRLMVYGFSLGSAPACELTANPRSLTPSKIILEANFASAAVMVQDGSQISMPASYFTNLKIDNAEEIKKISQPLFWMHGKNDLFLNIDTHGQVVYNNHGGTYKEAHKIDGADHGEVPEKYGFENYLRDLEVFIKK